MKKQKLKYAIAFDGNAVSKEECILTIGLSNINSQFDTGTKKSEPDIVFIV